jgi:hypothetical protein
LINKKKVEVVGEAPKEEGKKKAKPAKSAPEKKEEVKGGEEH